MVAIVVWHRRLTVLVLVVVLTAAGAPAPAQPAASDVELVSVTSGGVQAVGDSADASMSADGSQVAFDTTAPLDPPNDHADRDVYLRDRSTGTTVLISPAGGARPAVSATGRYVAYDTFTGESEIVVCDRDPDGDGVMDPRTYRYTLIPNGGSSDTSPSISADAGTIVWTRTTFPDTPVTMVATLPHGEHGTLLPPVGETVLLPKDPAYEDIRGGDGPAHVSADGTSVVFPVKLCSSFCGTSFARGGLLSLNGRPAQPIVHPAVYLATLPARTMSRVDIAATGPVISANGRVIAYEANGHVLTLDRDPDGDNVLWPSEPAQPTVVTDGSHPALSGDGRYLAFQTTEVLVLDRLGGPPAQPVAPSASVATVLSGDGSVVAFDSTASDLVPGDTNDSRDVFTRTFRPTLTAIPADFGTVPPGTAVTRTITLAHTGFGPLAVRGVAVAGSDFTVTPAETCTGTVLHHPDQCSVTVRFAASNPGDHQATLLVDTSTGQVRVPLQAVVEPGAQPTSLTASPATVVFPGERLVLTPSTPVVVTVTNPSSTPVAISGVTLLTGARLYPQDYVLTTTCAGAVLAPAGTCTVTIVSLPKGAGARPGTILVTSDATTGPLMVGLSATGTTPTLTVNPAVSPGGRPVTVAGTGFPAVHDITLPGTTAVVTNANGQFTASMTVPRHTGAGSTLVTATVPGTELTVSTPLLVVAGTFQPPGFTTRR